MHYTCCFKEIIKLSVMKKKLLIPSLLFAFAGTILAQGEMDAYKMSQTDMLGTARSVGMGGAVGAMGGDLTAVSVNPAGIGYFSSSQVATTLNFQNVNTESVMTGNTLKEGKFKTNFNNLGFVGVFKMQDNDVIPSLNFGFSFNRLKNFDRVYKSAGDGINSIGEYAAYIASSYKSISKPDYELDVSDYREYYPFDYYDPLTVLGYNAGLFNQIGESSNYSSNTNGYLNYNELFVKESGYVDSYDFNFGTNIANVVSLGMTVSVTDIKYKKYAMYSEATDHNSDGFALENFLTSEGTGVQVALGIIAQPIPQLRLGLAYHTPTWYDMTDIYNAHIDYNLQGIGGAKGSIDTREDYNGYLMGNSYFDYKFRSPDKLTLSAIGMFGPVLLSVDYDWINYSNNMRLKEGDMDVQGDVIKEDFNGASALRIGSEISFTKQFTGRVGYSWKQSPINKKVVSGEHEVMTVGTDNHYVLDKDTHHITWGLGYRFSKSFFADLAFVYKTQKGDMYMFDTESRSDRADLKTNTFQGMLTLGYRF